MGEEKFLNWTELMDFCLSDWCLISDEWHWKGYLTEVATEYIHSSLTSGHDWAIKRTAVHCIMRLCYITTETENESYLTVMDVIKRIIFYQLHKWILSVSARTFSDLMKIGISVEVGLQSRLEILTLCQCSSLSQFNWLHLHVVVAATGSLLQHVLHCM